MKKAALSLIVVAALIGGIFGVKSLKFVDTGKVGVVYSMRGGVKDEVLGQGAHFVNPIWKVKEFTIGNEQLILSKDERDGSEGDDSFKVATSDDASIAVSFQMSYRYNPDTVVDTYKKFKGMNGEDIVNQRVKTVLKSKISEVTTDYSMMDIYSGNRSEINNSITDYLNNEFSDEYGIQVIDASIIDVHPDKQLKKAIDNRVTALQEKQQAQAEQAKIKVQQETQQFQAEADAKIAITKAEADAQKTKIAAEAEAESNIIISQSITQELIDMEEAKARSKHGWVTVQGADSVVTTGK